MFLCSKGHKSGLPWFPRPGGPFDLYLIQSKTLVSPSKACDDISKLFVADESVSRLLVTRWEHDGRSAGSWSRNERIIEEYLDYSTLTFVVPMVLPGSTMKCVHRLEIGMIVL